MRLRWFIWSRRALGEAMTRLTRPRFLLSDRRLASIPMTNSFRLEQWRIVRRINAAGASITCICGKVSGNPDFQSGTMITTSRISALETVDDGLIARTINGSEYALGKPDASEPFAKRRLMRFVQESGNLYEDEGDLDKSAITPADRPLEE